MFFLVESAGQRQQRHRHTGCNWRQLSMDSRHTAAQGCNGLVWIRDTAYDYDTSAELHGNAMRRKGKRTRVQRSYGFATRPDTHTQADTSAELHGTIATFAKKGRVRSFWLASHERLAWSWSESSGSLTRGVSAHCEWCGATAPRVQAQLRLLLLLLLVLLLLLLLLVLVLLLALLLLLLQHAVVARSLLPLLVGLLLLLQVLADGPSAAVPGEPGPRPPATARR
jgi:hypothetical protein